MKSPDDSAFRSKSGATYRIRAVKSQDADAVTELSTAVFNEAVGHKAGAAVRDLGGATGVLGEVRERPIQANYWVAVDEGSRIDGIVGLYSPRWIGAQTLYLGWYAVRPDLQGMGVGRALFEHARRVALALGARSIMVETADEPAATVGFYHHVGFNDVTRVPDYWEDGASLRLMRLELQGRPAESP